MSDPYADFKSGTGSNMDATLISLADELVAAQRLVEAKEEELRLAKDALKDIAEVKIPTATDGLEGKFTLSDGRELTVKEDIRSSIAGEKKLPAIKWLDDNGYGHIVKREVKFIFGKDSQEQVDRLMNALSTLDNLPPVKNELSVHHSTLNSWVKEQLSEGVELPNETFGIYRQRVAKVK